MKIAIVPVSQMSNQLKLWHTEADAERMDRSVITHEQSLANARVARWHLHSQVIVMRTQIKIRGQT